MPKLTKEACRAARALLGMTTQEFGRAVGVSPTTVNAIEGGAQIRESTERRLVEKLDAIGVEITNGNGTGARLRWAPLGAYTGSNGLPAIAPYWLVEASQDQPGWWTARRNPPMGNPPASLVSRGILEEWLEGRGYTRSNAHPDVWLEIGEP